MKQRIYQIDAFTDRVFSGNPAAVCILESWLSDDTMQQIALEKNLSETAFAVKQQAHYELRWFTPETEIDLCGHATLATAYVLYHYYGHTAPEIVFYSPRSGELRVHRLADDTIVLNFPSAKIAPVAAIISLNEALGAEPLKTFQSDTDMLLIYASQEEIERMAPNFHLLNAIDCRGVIVSAPGTEVDFVSRFFAPRCGVPEDPVTGSAHTKLIPYWSKTLNKKVLTARQLSQRGGDLGCEYLGERVLISGKAAPYLVGELIL